MTTILYPVTERNFSEITVLTLAGDARHRVLPQIVRLAIQGMDVVGMDKKHWVRMKKDAYLVRTLIHELVGCLRPAILRSTTLEPLEKLTVRRNVESVESALMKE